jgi:hypothetical protein
VDELADLESYPEDQESAAALDSQDLEAQADRITEEFLALLLQEVKNN